MGLNEFIKIGNRIKSYRKNRNISQKEMARILDVPVSTYSNYENNNREPNPETLIKIANALGVSIQQLLFEDDKPKLRDIRNILSNPGFENASPFDLLENGKELKKQLIETGDKANNFLKDFLNDIDKDSFDIFDDYIEKRFNKELDIYQLKELYLKVNEFIDFEIYKLEKNNFDIERIDKNGK